MSPQRMRAKALRLRLRATRHRKEADRLTWQAGWLDRLAYLQDYGQASRDAEFEDGIDAL